MLNFSLHCHSHTVNLLSALPLQCLDVLLVVHQEPDSEQCLGVNMDCVHILLTFMERRLESVRAEVLLMFGHFWISLCFLIYNSDLFGPQGDKIKEKLTPILNLLTESCRAHRETRHYIRKQVIASPSTAHFPTHNILIISEPSILFFKYHTQLEF